MKTPIARVSRSRCSNDLRSSGGAAGGLDSRAAVPAGADTAAGAGETAGVALTFPFDRAGVAALGLKAGGGATGAAGSGAAAPLPCEVSGRGAGACAAGDAGTVLCPESGIAVRGFGDEQPQSASEAPRTSRTSNLIPYETGRRCKRSLAAGEHWWRPGEVAPVNSTAQEQSPRKSQVPSKIAREEHPATHDTVDESHTRRGPLIRLIEPSPRERASEDAREAVN